MMLVTGSVRTATFCLLRELGLTTIFGNPGSTEEAFLQGLPDDFRFVLGLHEASVVAMADGYAQARRTAAFVNLHTAAGVSNAMSALMTAAHNRTPLVITAGQQTREMLLLEPWLTNPAPEVLPNPWVKWSYQPARPQDVPAAIMRAYAIALQPPAGPVLLSLPLDDWDVRSPSPAVVRSVSTRFAPDPVRLNGIVDQINDASSPVLVLGADVARGQGWGSSVTLAERLNVPVWAAPACERPPFPENHPLYAGSLPFAQGLLSQQLAGHDVIIVVGAPVFRYYPWVPGPYLPAGAALIHVTSDPAEAARAPVGDSLLADAVLTIDALCESVRARKPMVPIGTAAHRASPRGPAEGDGVAEGDGGRLTPRALFKVLRRTLPPSSVMVEESPSNLADLHAEWIVHEPDSFYTFASGVLGWGLPAAVGLAIFERDTQRNRPVVAVIGDGSLQYAVQAIWTAVVQSLSLIIVVVSNDQYAILKAFAEFGNTPGVPGLDIPGLRSHLIAEGYGATGVLATTAGEVEAAVDEALDRTGPTVINVQVDRCVPKLL